MAAPARPGTRPVTPQAAAPTADKPDPTAPAETSAPAAASGDTPPVIAASEPQAPLRDAPAPVTHPTASPEAILAPTKHAGETTSAPATTLPAGLEGAAATASAPSPADPQAAAAAPRAAQAYAHQPVRQVAPVAIALALNPGQAPRVTIALEPQALGRVEIRIARDATGDASAVQVVAERPETLALLQRDARELDRALTQAGITLNDGGLRFDLAGQDGQRSDRERQGAPRQGSAAREPAPAAPPLVPGAIDPRTGLRSLLDIAV